MGKIVLLITEGEKVPVRFIWWVNDTAYIEVMRHAMIGHGNMLLAGTKLEVPMSMLVPYPNNQRKDQYSKI